MKVEVEVISKELIKPSSPTPDHLRHYKFSFLDQIAPQVYNPLLLFYEHNAKTQPNITEISNHLKNSLCEVLNLFYPLAGRIKNNQFIHCNDEGIPFVEARVLDYTLSDVSQQPYPCKIWAAIARGDQANINPPEFVSSTLFPPKEFNIGFDGSVGITKDRVTKRFVFDASQIENLRERYETSMHNMKKRPTRVETLSTFLWSRFVAATKDSTLNKLYMVIHAVNLRPRFDPPLPQSFFGNLFRLAMTAPLRIPSSGGDDECGHGMLIPVVREAIGNIDNVYVKKLQNQGDEHLGVMKKQADSFKRGEMPTLLSFSSYCRFPLYDNDFGWGRPTWVGSPALTYKNLVLFMDTKEGGGIEAYVSLEKEVMAKFECDSELLSYVAPTGRVLLS
ncbi:vinorine synthase-like [Prunus yedoensis var. nudiflora]|uniref:Vinorine synthase-like n=1 Tax=Prunus yedoensis var. nudiflora TaxID=2094558 RepID=A0A314XL49_PRUYE|nr:vinorine synthase-like [Prunus yedoensis var. nudiflora]